MSKLLVTFALQRSSTTIDLALPLVLGLGLTCAALPSLAQTVQGTSSDQRVNTRSSVALRSSPDSAGRIVMMVPPQTTLETLPGRFGPWLQVRTVQGVVGWLQSLDVNATLRPAAAFMPIFTRQAPDPVSPASMKGAVRSDRALDTLRTISTAVSEPRMTALSAALTQSSSAPLLTSPTTDATAGLSAGTRSSEGMAAVVTVTAPQLIADGPGRAKARLLEAQTYRTTSEEARKFAFNAGLERVKLTPNLSATSTATPIAEPVAFTSEAGAAIDTPKNDTADSAVLALLTDTPLSSNITLQVYVNMLGRWLSLESAQPDPQPNSQWTFAVLDSPHSQAYALPGGYVFITQGLLSKLSTEAELASVLAHGIALVADEHKLQALRTDDTLAADRSAVVLLTRSGFNPKTIASTLKLMSTRAQEKTLWSALIGPDSLTKQRLKALSSFMGTRFDEFPRNASAAPSVRIVQRLSELNTPDNLSASTALVQ